MNNFTVCGLSIAIIVRDHDGGKFMSADLLKHQLPRIYSKLGIKLAKRLIE